MVASCWNAWTPRPDQPERYDQQESFFFSQHAGPTFLLGGNGAGTTETMLAKVAEFVLQQQPPPRPDTPFWIIAGSYTQACEACWKEKLLGHGHIPESEIDWKRISWLDKKQGHPSTVPLLPWPTYTHHRPDVNPRANWVLEFKSWRQQLNQMSARSIGGFAFTEQFPWGLFQEVYRGCREYSYTGNKLAEFTPIDPSLCFELQEMIEQDRIPPTWGMYRANTECALEAGHVTQQWYDDFFGMVPEEMLLVRQIGEFGAFDGTIYPSFTVRTHVRGDADITFPRGVYHARVLDWGSGGEHPFACLWGYRELSGRWVIYDELYVTDRLTTPDYLAMVHERSLDWGWKPDTLIWGPTWADTADPASMLMASQLSTHRPECDNMSVRGARKNVRAGIEHVQLAMKSQARFNGPGLIIHENCRNLIRELRTYRWVRSNPKNHLNPRSPVREPLKIDDHLADCLRYLLYSEAVTSGITIDRVAKAHELQHYRHGVQFSNQR